MVSQSKTDVRLENHDEKGAGKAKEIMVLRNMTQLAV